MAVNLNYLLQKQDILNYLTGMGYQAPSDVNVDNLIMQFRASAHHDISEYLGYEFLSDTYTLEAHDGPGTHELWLDNQPVTEVTALQEDKKDYAHFTYPAPDIAQPYVYGDVELLEGKYLFMDKDWFRKGIRNWRVTYKAGWTYATLPQCIRQAALEYIYLCTMTKRIGKLSVTDGAGGNLISYDPDIDKKILGKCDGHRMWRF